MNEDQKSKQEKEYSDFNEQILKNIPDDKKDLIKDIMDGREPEKNLLHQYLWYAKPVEHHIVQTLVNQDYQRGAEEVCLVACLKFSKQITTKTLELIINCYDQHCQKELLQFYFKNCFIVDKTTAEYLYQRSKKLKLKIDYKYIL